MAGIKPTTNRRLSLCPPHGDKSKPNASMVDLSNIEISIRRHIRQRDQNTATKEEHERKLNEQRPSLLHAAEIIDYWKKTDSVNHSTNIKNNTQQSVIKKEQKEKLNEERLSLHHAVGLTDYSKIRYSSNVQINKDQVKK